MISKIMDKLGRRRVIRDRESKQPYLIRYYVFLKDRKKFPFNITVHKVLKSDKPVLHDHPWNYSTFIIKGGYWEWYPLLADNGEVVGSSRKWRGPGSFIRAKANSMHRVELEPGITPWTIFIPGKKKKDWGFIIPKKVHNEQLNVETIEYKWVDHKTHLGENV